jgi:hypothetical protein
VGGGVAEDRWRTNTTPIKENTVRKILTILIALVAIAALPALASADVPHPSYDNTTPTGQDAGQACSTGWQTGVFGQYGAQGFYVDGCTATVRCPSYARFGCGVHGTGTIADKNYAYDAMNARLRMYDSRGALLGFKDTSCPIPGSWGYQGCTTPRLDGTLGANGLGTVQCNGVRQTSTQGLAQDTCRVYLFVNSVQ